MVCADPKPASFDIITENFPASVTHFFPNLQAQVGADGCKLHPQHGSCAFFKKPPHLGVIGTPCQPFSRQRCKRSAEGSVRAHAKYDTTFVDMIDWLKCFEPMVAIGEQVAGIDIPESVTNPETPLDRPTTFHLSHLSPVKSEV